MYSDVAYAPFGEAYVSAGTTDLSFTGQNQGTAYGLQDFLFREYHPVSGRWISPDPAGLAAATLADPRSWNRYAYVGNQPLNNTDPSGLVYGDCGYGCSPHKLWFIAQGTDEFDLLFHREPVPTGRWIAFVTDLGSGEVPVMKDDWVFRGIIPLGTNTVTRKVVVRNVNDFSWWGAFGRNLFSWQNAKQAQTDAWNKGYYKCLAQKNLPGFSAAATVHVATDVAGETATYFSPQLAGAYYHLTDARFTAWGKYSEVLVPEAAANIKLWGGRLNAAGWAYADYELAKSIGECSEALQ